ncbi:ABC transporter substrate-binding protein [Glutamicibacter nicotianae]|uniref:ABC transporter substrate-binding protein n=1 Tax=Glutamicibacter nicotianae TaxID=37929 RepID=UPI003C2E52EE
MQRPDPGTRISHGARIRLAAASPATGFRGRIAGLAGVAALAALAVLTTVVPGPGQAPAHAADLGPAAELKLGYFANLTHAPALISTSQDLLADQLEADGTSLETQLFNAGPAAIEALNSGAIDAAYLGPSPALNSYLASGGKSLKIVAGASSGGASLVVSPDISEPGELAGTELATPQFGGTQDVALRHYLAEHGLDQQATVTPSSNATLTQLFGRGAIDGAWVPEPYASLLVENYGGHRLVDESTLWENGKFPTTVLVVSQDYLTEHPRTVEKLVAANSEAIGWLNSADQQHKAAAVQEALAAANGSSFDETVIAAALEEVSFDEDPLADTYQTLIDHAAQVGIGQTGSVDGLVDTRFLATQEH